MTVTGAVGRHAVGRSHFRGQHHRVFVSVADDATGLFELHRGRPLQLAHRKTVWQFVGDLGGETGLAGVAPVDVPTRLGFQKHAKVEALARPQTPRHRPPSASGRGRPRPPRLTLPCDREHRRRCATRFHDHIPMEGSRASHLFPRGPLRVRTRAPQSARSVRSQRQGQRPGQRPGSATETVPGHAEGASTGRAGYGVVPDRPSGPASRPAQLRYRATPGRAMRSAPPAAEKAAGAPSAGSQPPTPPRRPRR